MRAGLPCTCGHLAEKRLQSTELLKKMHLLQSRPGMQEEYETALVQGETVCVPAKNKRLKEPTLQGLQAAGKFRKAYLHGGKWALQKSNRLPKN